MSNIITNYSQVASSDYPLVTRINSEYLNAVNADSYNRSRSFRNFKAYLAIEGGQMPDELNTQLAGEDRVIETYNILGPKVDILTGALSREKFDHDFKPMYTARNSLTEALRVSWLADKDLCHYADHEERAIRNSLIYNSIMKMGMSDKYDPKTNIVYECMQPGWGLFDPYWTSDDDEDCDRFWEIFYLNAIQIKEIYGDKAKGPLLEGAIQRYRQQGGEYDMADYSFDDYMRLGMRGHLFKVIKYVWMETAKTTRLTGQQMGTGAWVNFPITKREDILEEFMLKNSIDPNTMVEGEYKDRICKYACVCPDLAPEVLLAHQLSEIQVKRLPYFHLAACRILGKDKGIVDELIDLNRKIDRLETKMTHLIETAGGGGKLVNRDLFKTTAERRNFEQNQSRPDYVEWVDGDEIASNRAIHYLNQESYNPAIIDELKRMWDVVDRISKVPSAMEAMTQSANESGVLFDRRLEVAQMATVTLVNQIRNWKRKMGEAYYYQWQLSYNGHERQMATMDGKWSTTLNKKIYDPYDSKIYVLNRPAMIPRTAVVVTESRSNPTKVMRERALWAELFDRAVQTDPESAYIFFEELMKTMDMDDEAKAKVQEFSLLRRARSRKKFMADIASLDATEKQAMMASMQSVMMMQQMGGGAPQEQALPEARVPLEAVEAEQYGTGGPGYREQETGSNPLIATP